MDMSTEEMKERNSRVNYEWGHDPVWRHTTYKHDMSDVSNINFKLVDESTRKFPKSLEIKRNPQLKQPHLSPELIREFQQQRIHPLKRMGGFALGYDPPDHLSTYTKGNLSYQWQKPRDQHELIETQNVFPPVVDRRLQAPSIKGCDFVEIGRKFNRHQFIKRQQEAKRFQGILANDYVKDIEQDFPTKLSSYDQTNWHPMTSLRGKNRKFLIHCFENRNQHDSLWASMHNDPHHNFRCESQDYGFWATKGSSKYPFADPRNSCSSDPCACKIRPF